VSRPREYWYLGVLVFASHRRMGLLLLAKEFANLLKELVIPPAVLDWLSEAVLSSDRTEQAARAETIKKYQGRQTKSMRASTVFWCVSGDPKQGRIRGSYFGCNGQV
jgi:hypothetical protein